MSERLRVWRMKIGEYGVSINPFNLEDYNCECIHASIYRFKQDGSKQQCKHYKLALKVLLNSIQQVIEKNGKSM